MTVIGLSIMAFFLVREFLRWESAATYRKLKKDLNDGVYTGHWKHQIEKTLVRVRHHYEPGELQILAIMVGAVIFIVGLQGH
jgi:hypothetical protein